MYLTNNTHLPERLKTDQRKAFLRHLLISEKGNNLIDHTPHHVPIHFNITMATK